MYVDGVSLLSEELQVCWNTRDGIACSVQRCNEFGDETNQRLVEPGMSAKRVDTSMRLVGDDFCVAA